MTSTVKAPAAGAKPHIRKRIHRRLKNEIRKIDAMIRKPFVRVGGAASSTYYRLLGPQFSHEFRTVGHGIAEYQRRELTEQDVFHFRRNIHMLEKGLVMKPRRDTFAVNYIEDTVKLLQTLLSSFTLSEAERSWGQHVLDEYFEATASSSNARIRRAETAFRQVVESAIEERTHAPLPRPAVPSELPSIDSLLALASTRRSVRWYRPEPIPREAIDRAISVGMEAPTACNRQPYRFLVIEDEALRAKVASIPMGTGGFAHQFPGLMVLLGDQSAFFSERDRHLIYIDSCLAAGGVILGLEAQGIASCVINWPDIPEREREMRRALDLAPHEQVIMLLSFGYEDTSERAPYSAKKSVESARVYI